MEPACKSFTNNDRREIRAGGSKIPSLERLFSHAGRRKKKAELGRSWTAYLVVISEHCRHNGAPWRRGALQHLQGSLGPSCRRCGPETSEPFLAVDDKLALANAIWTPGGLVTRGRVVFKAEFNQHNITCVFPDALPNRTGVFVARVSDYSPRSR